MPIYNIVSYKRSIMSINVLYLKKCANNIGKTLLKSSFCLCDLVSFSISRQTKLMINNGWYIYTSLTVYWKQHTYTRTHSSKNFNIFYITRLFSIVRVVWFFNEPFLFFIKLHGYCPALFILPDHEMCTICKHIVALMHIYFTHISSF